MLRALPHTFKSQTKLCMKVRNRTKMLSEREWKNSPRQAIFIVFFFSLEIRSPSLLSEANSRETFKTRMKSIFLKLEFERKRIKINLNSYTTSNFPTFLTFLLYCFVGFKLFDCFWNKDSDLESTDNWINQTRLCTQFLPICSLPGNISDMKSLSGWKSSFEREIYFKMLIRIRSISCNTPEKYVTHNLWSFLEIVSPLAVTQHDSILWNRRFGFRTRRSQKSNTFKHVCNSAVFSVF